MLDTLITALATLLTAARMEPAPWLSTWANYAWTRATYQSQAELFSIRGEDEFG